MSKILVLNLQYIATNSSFKKIHYFTFYTHKYYRIKYSHIIHIIQSIYL